MNIPEDYSIYDLSMSEKVRIAVLTAASALTASILFYDSPVPAAAAVFLYRPAAGIYRESRIRKRKKELLSAFRDFLNSLSSSFTANRSMTDAIYEADGELLRIYGKNNIMWAEVHNMAVQLRAGRMYDVEVLENLASRADEEDIDDFVQVYRSCREHGGDMISTMTKTAGMITEKICIENDIRAMLYQKKMEGMIISAVPLLILAMLRAGSRSYIEPLYSTLTGRIVMTAAICGIALAYHLIKKITEVEI
jgi:tight adherence protein B